MSAREYDGGYRSMGSLLVIFLIIGSFAPLFLDGKLFQYLPMVLLVFVVAAYQLYEEKIFFPHPVVVFLPYISWIIVSFAATAYIGGFNPQSLIYSYGSVVSILTCIILSQFLSNNLLSRSYLFLGLIGTITAGIPVALAITYSIIQGSPMLSLSVDHLSIFSGIGDLGILANYGAILLGTSMATVVLANSSRRVWGAALLIQVVAILLVGARSTLVALVLFSSFYFMLELEKIENIKFLIVLGLAVVSSLFTTFLIGWEPVLDTLAASWFNEITSNRGHLWLMARHAALDHLLLGTGFQQAAEAMEIYHTEVNAPSSTHGLGPHNTALRILLVSGLPGLLWFIMILYTFFIFALRSPLSNPDEQFYLSAVVGFLGFGTFESLLIGGLSARSFLLTLFIITGLVSFQTTTVIAIGKQ